MLVLISDYFSNNTTSKFKKIKLNAGKSKGIFNDDLTLYHSKCKSPVKSNSTVGITLVINFKKMRSAN